MGRDPVFIPIHGAMLRGFIEEKSRIDDFAKEMGVSRQTVHAWTSKGKISPAGLSKAVKFLNLSSDDVRLLERIEQTIMEKKIAELRHTRSILIEIMRLAKEGLGEK